MARIGRTFPARPSLSRLPAGVAEHGSTGALDAQAATVTGSAAHLTLHTATGALDAQPSALTGAAAHHHAASGALSAQESSISGSAQHQHVATGALASDSAAISGAADHTDHQGRLTTPAAHCLLKRQRLRAVRCTSRCTRLPARLMPRRRRLPARPLISMSPQVRSRHKVQPWPVLRRTNMQPPVH